MKLNIIFGNQSFIYKFTLKKNEVSPSIAPKPSFTNSIAPKPSFTDNRKNNLHEFGQEIRRYREQKGKNIVEVAKIIGIDRSYLSKLENGREHPTLSILSKLISYLSITREAARQLAILAGYAGGGLIYAEFAEGR